ncbi:MAG: hypothetical protein A2571_01515 [Candidatus Vogelbacteria bacterium RIFOXYD1_FULL_44_32]|uniref:Uncharacterized protein n=1 Tax=Candidatus Vogelbacteria bacterium RIFOXYD1_FULL_44_32 TaxID=1802438 RepID=A0A1G2QEE2_9BACT|nr:MAG: hypothetical protein A2571_01515 [Candidatus Vogelbacteria bacterium RIFOXYD1_FULL_44_32]
MRVLIAGMVAVSITIGTIALIPFFIPGTPMDTVYAAANSSMIPMTESELARGRERTEENARIEATTPARDWWEAQGWDLDTLEVVETKLTSVTVRENSSIWRFHGTADIEGKIIFLSLAPAEAGTLTTGETVYVFMTSPVAGLVCKL